MIFAGPPIIGLVSGWWCTVLMTSRERRRGLASATFAAASVALEVRWLSGSILPVYGFAIGFGTALLTHIVFRSWIRTQIHRHEGLGI